MLTFSMEKSSSPHHSPSPRGHQWAPHPQRAPNWHPALSNRIPLCHSASDVTLKVHSIQAEENRFFCRLMRYQSCCPKCQFPLGQIHVQATLTLLGLCSISTNAKKFLLRLLHNNCCITHLKRSWMHRTRL